jgi:hypothetical protein
MDRQHVLEGLYTGIMGLRWTPAMRSLDLDELSERLFGDERPSAPELAAALERIEFRDIVLHDAAGYALRRPSDSAHGTSFALLALYGSLAIERRAIDPERIARAAEGIADAPTEELPERVDAFFGEFARGSDAHYEPEAIDSVMLTLTLALDATRVDGLRAVAAACAAFAQNPAIPTWERLMAAVATGYGVSGAPRYEGGDR